MSRKIIWINRSMVTSPYHIGLCRSEKSFKKELCRLKVPKHQRPEWLTSGKDGKCHFFDKIKDHSLCCIVCISDKCKPSKSQVVGLLVHEAMHIWDDIVDELNEKYPSSEFKAYSVQNITQRLLEAYDAK